MSNGGAAGGAFGGGQARAPKLEIKKDPKGMVTVPGATIVEARPPSPPAPPIHARPDPLTQARNAVEQ